MQTTTSISPSILPLLAVTTGTVLPEMVVTIRVETDDARRAVDAAAASGQPELASELVLVPRIGSRYAAVGVVVRIEQRGALPDGSEAVVVRGLRRVRVGAGVVGDTDALWVEVEELAPESTAVDDELRPLIDEYRRVAGALLAHVGGRRFAGALDEIDAPGVLADTIGWWPTLSFERRFELVETIEVPARLRLATQWAAAALNEASVIGDINEKVSGEFTKAQREAVLRRQLHTIKEELGEGDGDAVAEYRTRLAAVEVAETVRVAIEKEIERLERIGEQSMESSWIRTWLDTVLEIPWGTRSDDNLDLSSARAILDADHTGLADVKDRIIEFLAVRKRRAEKHVDTAGFRRAGTVLVLVGPPGVGKTSLGESVARTLRRKFVRTALGGIHDEAEIRGHRRTYVGARPGRIARALIDAGTMNPVLLLDEIDKVGSDYRGDPTAALLEVLDPAQNHTFRDHYLELELDLSGVVFIATANSLDRVPAPLLDRMEVITIAGYSDDEKLAIARDHLIPRVLETNAVDADEVALGDDVVAAVIAGYTREAGVRRLEQRLDRLVRKAATKLATDPAATPIVIGADEVRDALGRAMPDDRPADRVDRPGIATGLAVTGAGGDVLFVEAVAMDGEPGVTLTGQLGDVMRESGTIAVSYLRSHADQLGIDPSHANRRFHVHFPAGAIPKDGPSAGVTMTTAIASLLTDRQVRPNVGMTGEVTLQGRVLPIGGVKEKVLAAHRCGLTEVILPADNAGDAEDIPDDVRAAMTLHFVTDVAEVLELALSP